MHYLLSFQILLDRNGRTRASKLLWGGYIIRCLLFSSGASFCQSPGFYSSTMVVLWLLTGAEISNMGEQCECTLTS